MISIILPKLRSLYYPSRIIFTILTLSVSPFLGTLPLSKVYAKEIFPPGVKHINSQSLEARVIHYASLFIGKEYQRPNYQYDIEPQDLNDITKHLSKSELIYSFERYDCVTLVEIVLALTYSASPRDKEEFEKQLKKIRYHDPSDSYIYRNHFTSADWIVHNSDIATDITRQVYPHAKSAVCRIDRLEWIIRTHPLIKKYTKDMSHEELYTFKSRIKEYLQSHRFKVEIEEVNTPYIPLDIVINTKVTDLFPKVGIVHIVRPNWNLKKAIGTNLNISHLGFIIREGDEISFIHASSYSKKVVKVDLIEYLKQQQKSSTVKGINVMKIE